MTNTVDMTNMTDMMDMDNDDLEIVEENMEETEQVKASAEESSSLPDPVTKYLREISQYPLLTADEEKVLSAEVRAGKEAEKHLSEDESLTEEQKKDYEALVEAGQQAQKQLVSSNLRLVVVIAKSYQGRGLSLLDLIQEGNLGLMRAAEKYDATTGNRFSTCAAWWIRQAISRAITDQGRSIRLPGNVYNKVSQLRRAQRELTAKLEREPTEEELAEEMGISVKKVKELIQCAMDVASLDAPVKDDDSSAATLGDFAGSVTPMEEVDETVTNVALTDVLNKALDGLDDREKHVLEMRYGLNGNSVHTLESVSKELGLTRERVRQIENRALRHLRTGSQSKELSAFMD